MALGETQQTHRGRAIYSSPARPEQRHRPEASTRPNCVHQQPRRAALSWNDIHGLLQRLRETPNRDCYRGLCRSARLWTLFRLRINLFLPTSRPWFKSSILPGTRRERSCTGRLFCELVRPDAVSHTISQKMLAHCDWQLTDISRRFGRRTVYVWGMAAMATELCIIGILNPWTHRKSVGWAQALLTLVWTFTFQLSAGQLGKFQPHNR